MANKICVYAICKNEIQFAKKWIDSMSEADYIVVLDTGSDDGTYEFLKSHKKITRVEQKIINPWRFDVARNESMKLIPKDANILLCTDFDELFEPGWANVIRENWKENTCRGHYMYAWSHTGNGNNGLTFIYDKLHNREYHWMFPVHEVLLRKDGEREDPERVIELGESVFLHHYPDNEKSRASYMDLLKVRVEEFPDEAYGHYLLGRELGVYEKYEEALERFKYVLELPDIENKPLVKYQTLGYIGDLYRCLNDPMNAIMYYHKQIDIDRTYREPYLHLADIYLSVGLYGIAIGFVQDAFTNTYQHFNWAEQSEAWNEKPYDILSVAYFYLNEIDLGIQNAERALSISPNDERMKKNYQALLDKQKEMLLK